MSLVFGSRFPVADVSPVPGCWHEQIGDPTLADGILDRLVHNAHRIEMRGDSMRKNQESRMRNFRIARHSGRMPCHFPQLRWRPAKKSTSRFFLPKGLTKSYLFDNIKKMPKGSDDLLGTLELIVLLSLLSLGTDAYGIPIRDEIHRRIGRNISFGAVYVTLQRLQGKGLVESRMGEPTAERGGRAKKFFRVTKAGRQAVDHSRHAIEVMSAGLQEARGAV